MSESGDAATPDSAFGPERQAAARAAVPAVGARDDGPPPAIDSVDLAVPARAVGVFAHADDAEFFCTGTFAKWAAAGAACHYVVLTDGTLGSWGDLTPGELHDLRRVEQDRAAELAGVRSVVYLDEPDGFVEASLEVRRKIATVLRRIAPDVVVTHDPWKRWRLHPDHRACGFATCDAVTVAREPNAYPDLTAIGLGSFRPRHLWLAETDAPDHAEDISATFATKLAALHAHVSQYRSTMGADGPDDASGLAAFDDRIATWCASMGAPAGLACAESFRRLPL